MRRALLLLLAPLLLAGDVPEGKYRPAAKPDVIAGWEKDFREKKPLVPPPPRPLPSTAEATDFSGRYRFGPYDYTLEILQQGDQIVLTSGGVDHQDIGGAFDTIGIGRVEGDRIRARWWCFDLSRNYANNGGAELWFEDGRIRARYYHDADEAIEEGYGVRLGTRAGEKLHYRIRVPRQVKPGPVEVTGTVSGFDGEVLADALVMVRNRPADAVRTDARGRFRLPVARMPYVLMVSAAARGYRNQVQAILLHEVRELRFVLEPSPYADDPRYEFVDPTPDKGPAIWSCGNCHKNSYAEWSKSRHAVAATSAVLRAVYEKDFLPAVRSGGAPGDEGLCAACHAPQAALDGRVARIGAIEGAAARGNHCDLCHKVHHVERTDAPGVRGSLALGRPSPDDARVPGRIKRVYGALPDSDYLFMGAVWNPLFATSTLCAGCHEYETPAGIPALSTYTEWRAWAAGRAQAETCETCHMPAGVSKEGSKLANRICVNALRRPPETIHEHSFLGRELLPTAVELKAAAERRGERLVVEARIKVSATGHKVPTGSADKHLLLVVAARDAGGKPLPLAEGPRVPEHGGGTGDPLVLDAPGFAKRIEAHDFAGMPGREFAQVLGAASGGTHVPFWRAAKVVADTRLAPDAETTETFAFVPPPGAARVTVELWHRLRFKGHDVAADAEGPGVRPLDQLVARVEIP
ncbi:MAG TPA: multiheme c-type cytochrome [Planctomycetota bacterium]|nr:multiheme c-type cytochrome [Planctomycetota bacterium]